MTLDKDKISVLLHCDGPYGSQVFTDDSPHNHLVAVGGDTYIDDTAGRFAQSAYADSFGDYLGIAAHDSLSFPAGQPGTVDLWYVPGNRASYYPRVWQFGYNWAPGVFCLVDRDGNHPTKFTVSSYQTGDICHSLVDVSIGVLYHLRVTFGDGFVRLFVDGIKQAEVPWNYNINTVQRQFRVFDSGGDPNTFGQGNADEILVYRDILSTTDFTPPSSPWSTASVFSKVFRVLHGDIIQRPMRISHGLFPQVLKLFRALPGAAPVRSKTFRVVHDQARSFAKIFRVVHQQSTFIQKVFRVVQQQKNSDLVKVIRVVHGTKAGEAVLKVFRAIHGLVAGSYRSDTFDVSLRVGNQPVLSWSAATLSTDEGRFVWEAQVTVRQRWDAETLLGQYDPVVYSRYGTDYHLIVTDKAMASSISDDKYEFLWIVYLASPAYMLSAGKALPVTKTWPRGTAAKAIVQELCDAKSITLDWQAPEYVLAELVADKQSPIDIIRTVCNVIGALPQSAPSGALIVRKETPIMPDSKAVPAATFAALSIVQLSEQSDDPAVLYNAVRVSDSTEPGSDAGGLQHVEADRTDGGKDIKAWSEPWVEIALRVNSAAGETSLSSGKLVVADYLDNNGEPEWVQFVDGKSTASRPVYQGFAVVDFQGANPGSISWQPDSKDLIASNGGEYYVQIAYQWRYYEFIYYSNTGEKYQLVLND